MAKNPDVSIFLSGRVAVLLERNIWILTLKEKLKIEI